MGGRLSRFPVHFGIRHPIILLKEGIVTLVLNHCQKKTQHKGQGITLNELRANGFQIGTSNVVTRYIKDCVTCRPPEEQCMADLPVERMGHSPFSYTGIDCFL